MLQNESLVVLAKQSASIQPRTDLPKFDIQERVSKRRMQFVSLRRSIGSIDGLASVLANEEFKMNKRKFKMNTAKMAKELGRLGSI